MSTETSDRVGLTLVPGRISQAELSATCRDEDTREWFLEAKARSEERMGRDLTHEEFTQLLLEIYEYHEPDREADRDE